MEIVRKSNYAKSILDPERYMVDIPDMDMTSCVKKSVSLSKNITVPSTPNSGELLFLWIPESKQTPLYVFVWVVGAPSRYVFLYAVQPNQILSDSYTRGRLISSILKLVSSTISTTNATTSGTINAAAYQEIPNYASLTYQTLTSYVRDGKSVVVNERLEEGVAALSQPTGSQPFVIFDNSTSYSSDSNLVVNHGLDGWVSAPTALAANVPTIFYDSDNDTSLPIPPNCFGAYLYKAFSKLTATVAGRYSVTVNLYRRVVSEVDFVTVTNLLFYGREFWIGALDASGNNSFQLVGPELPDLNGPIDRIVLLITSTAATTVTLNSYQFQSSYPNYYFNGNNSPGVALAVQGVGLSQTISLGATLNFEAVPDFVLAQNVATQGPNFDSDIPMEMFLVQRFLTMEPRWKLVQSLTDYKHLLRSELDEMTDLNVMAQAAGFSDFFNIIKPFAPIVGGLLGGPAGAGIASGLVGIGDSLLGQSGDFQNTTSVRMPYNGKVGGASVFRPRIGNASVFKGRTADWDPINKPSQRVGIMIGPNSSCSNYFCGRFKKDSISFCSLGCYHDLCENMQALHSKAVAPEGYREIKGFVKIEDVGVKNEEDCIHVCESCNQDHSAQCINKKITGKTELLRKEVLMGETLIPYSVEEIEAEGRVRTAALLYREYVRGTLSMMMKGGITQGRKQAANRFPIVLSDEEVKEGFVFVTTDPLNLSGTTHTPVYLQVTSANGAVAYIGVQSEGQADALGMMGNFDELPVIADRVLASSFTYKDAPFVTFFAPIGFDGFSFMAALAVSLNGLSSIAFMSGAYTKLGAGLLPNLLQNKLKGPVSEATLIASGSSADVQSIPDEEVRAEVVGALRAGKIVLASDVISINYIATSMILKGQASVLAATVKGDPIEPPWGAKKTLEELFKLDVTEGMKVTPEGEVTVHLPSLLEFWDRDYKNLDPLVRERVKETIAQGLKKYEIDLRDAIRAQNESAIMKALKTMATIQDSLMEVSPEKKKKGKVRIYEDVIPSQSFTSDKNDPDSEVWTVADLEDELKTYRGYPKLFVSANLGPIKALADRITKLKAEWEEVVATKPNDRLSKYGAWQDHGRAALKLTGTIDTLYEAYTERAEKKKENRAKNAPKGASKAQKKKTMESAIGSLLEEDDEG